MLDAGMQLTTSENSIVLALARADTVFNRVGKMLLGQNKYCRDRWGIRSSADYHQATGVHKTQLMVCTAVVGILPACPALNWPVMEAEDNGRLSLKAVPGWQHVLLLL